MATNPAMLGAFRRRINPCNLRHLWFLPPQFVAGRKTKITSTRIPHPMLDFTTPIARVRNIGRIEGISFLLLMGVAMPLKYLADQPLAVKYVGWAHGVLFIALCMVLFQAWADKHLSFRQSCIVFIAALLPFGPFLIDRYMFSEDTDEA